MFAIHGFQPGEVVPSTDLVMIHKHPDDRPAVESMFRNVRETGEAFSLWHRIVDAQGRVRQVLVVGEGVRDASGRLTGLRGNLVDLSAQLRRATAAEVEEAVNAMAQSRPVIEQVKGGLMVRFGLDPDAAFEVLRHYSQTVNVKVRDLARQMVDAMSGGCFPVGDLGTWEDLVDEVRAQSTTQSTQSTTATGPEQSGTAAHEV
jgi:hypothetical protein